MINHLEVCLMLGKMSSLEKLRRKIDNQIKTLAKTMKISCL
uniref:Uncharacterized protein n=1 Tax=Rhizophora mucronata TaxID=61149 RepID=A0A2P2IIG1_RHIMU